MRAKKEFYLRYLKDNDNYKIRQSQHILEKVHQWIPKTKKIQTKKIYHQKK